MTTQHDNQGKFFNMTNLGFGFPEMSISIFKEQLESRQFPVEWPGHFLASGWHRSGKMEDTGERRRSANPGTGEILVATTTEREAKSSLDTAIEQANHARLAMRALPVDVRMDELRAIRRALGDHSHEALLALRMECGLTPAEADMDLSAALRHFDHVLEHPQQIESALLAPARLGIHGPGSREDYAMLPVGIVLGYLPFSSPIATFATQVTGAFLAGCPLIAMPGPHSSLIGILLGHIAAGLSLTRGSLQVVFGNFEVLRHALLNKKIAAVLYTGSREHCERIRAESRVVIERQLVLQSGGKNAVMVHESADVSAAVRATLAGALRAAGQMCTSTSRVFVHRSLSAMFCGAIEDSVTRLKIGRTDLPAQDRMSGADSLPGHGSPHMGPLYGGKAVDKFLRFQTMARREAKKSLATGKKIPEFREGNFVMPGIHLMKQFDASSSYQSNVVFAPDIAIHEYDQVNDAIEAVNATDAAFVLSFFGDPAVIQEWRHHLLPPNVVLNGPTTEYEANLPLAGRLQSGHHRFHGTALALYLSYPQVILRQCQAIDAFTGCY